MRSSVGCHYADGTACQQLKYAAEHAVAHRDIALVLFVGFPSSCVFGGHEEFYDGSIRLIQVFRVVCQDEIFPVLRGLPPLKCADKFHRILDDVLFIVADFEGEGVGAVFSGDQPVNACFLCLGEEIFFIFQRVDKLTVIADEFFVAFREEVSLDGFLRLFQIFSVFFFFFFEAELSDCIGGAGFKGKQP